MTEILSTTQTTSSEFIPVNGGAYQILLIHNGGTWTLQVQYPGLTNWTDTDITWDGSGIQRMYLIIGWTYRISGGTLGARATIGSETGTGGVQT